MHEEVSQVQSNLTTSTSLTKATPLLKKANLDSIIRRCKFVSTVFNQSENLSAREWDSLIKILQLTSNGGQIVNELTKQRQATSYDIENEPGTEEAPQHPTCAWINQITNGTYCDRCDMCGVIKSPITFGFSPWNTNKRIMYLDGHLDDQILVSEAVLSDYPEIFYQDERLVRVISDRSKAISGSQYIPLRVKPVTAANLREMLSTKFVFLTIEEDKFRAVYPPPPLVSSLLERANYPSLKHLRGITEVPVLRPDGTVLQAAGYDAAMELLYQPRQAFPPVPDNPTEEEIKEAVNQLLEVVSDFPFTSDIGRAVYLSTILTVVGRFAFQGCVPMILIDANTPGVGKTKLADAIGIITTGQPLPRTTQANYAEEERRQITAILKKGERLLLIDNIGSCFGSAVMDALLTSEIWQDRVLGRSQEVTLPNLLQVIATGNNLQLKADTVRRCLRIQLNSPDEHPEARSGFKHNDLEAWVTSQQPQFLVAAMTLLRGYMAAGKPKQEIATLGSFSGWSDLIQSTVKWAYGQDPGKARILSEDEMDLDKEILESLMRGWQNLVPDGSSRTCRWVMDYALEGSDSGRDILEALEMRSSSGKRTAVALGRLLTHYRKRVHMGAYFDHGCKERTSDGRQWKLFTTK